MAAALIRRLHEAKVARAATVAVWGTGTPRREFLYVDDLADACVFLMQRYSGEEMVNIGIGDDMTIAEFAHRRQCGRLHGPSRLQYLAARRHAEEVGQCLSHVGARVASEHPTRGRACASIPRLSHTVRAGRGNRGDQFVAVECRPSPWTSMLAADQWADLASLSIRWLMTIVAYISSSTDKRCLPTMWIQG